MRYLQRFGVPVTSRSYGGGKIHSTLGPLSSQYKEGYQTVKAVLDVCMVEDEVFLNYKSSTALMIDSIVRTDGEYYVLWHHETEGIFYEPGATPAVGEQWAELKSYWGLKEIYELLKKIYPEYFEGSEMGFFTKEQ